MVFTYVINSEYSPMENATSFRLELCQVKQLVLLQKRSTLNLPIIDHITQSGYD